MSADGGELHTRLRLARERGGFTQAEMAASAGIALNTLKQYESGRIKPGAEALAGYARAGINVVYVLLGEGEALLAKYPEPKRNGGFMIGESDDGRRWEIALPRAAESMRIIVLGIEECAAALNLRLADEKKTELTQTLFEEFVEAGTRPRLSTIQRFVKAAAGS